MCLYIAGLVCIMFNVSLLYFVDFAFVKVYDTIRYNIFSCTKKLMNSQLNLPHRTKIKNSAVAEMGDHLAMVGMGQKVRAGCCAPFRGGTGSPSNTMWPGPSSVPSGILIHPAVLPQQTWAENWGAVPL